MYTGKLMGARRQRGVTMVSVMLLVLALLTLGVLVVRSSVREMTQAGQLVARERALMVAQAAVDLASAQLRNLSTDDIDASLAGYNAQGNNCSYHDMDCIPGANGIITGQRNELLAGTPVDCGGRPCMRQGAVVRLADTSGTVVDWCGANNGIPFRDLVPGGDAEASVCVWVRNNAADALGADGSGSWTDDTDGRVVVTAMATIRNTQIAVEQEVMLFAQLGPQVYKPQSPDEGYGGGHNNDNTAVALCKDEYVLAAKAE